MSAVNLWEVVADPVYAGPNRDILAACASGRAAISRILKVAERVDGVAINAIVNSADTVSLTHLAISAAQEAWTGFALEYREIILAFGACSTEAFTTYVLGAAATDAHHLCPTPYDLGLWLGKLKTYFDDIEYMTKKSTSTTGAYLSEAAYDLAYLGSQITITFLGTIWPAVWGNGWPNATCNVFHVDYIDGGEGHDDMVTILGKTANGAAVELAEWWKFSECPWLPAPTGSALPADLAVGDKIIIEMADWTQTTEPADDPGYYQLKDRRLELTIHEFDGNNARAFIEGSPQLLAAWITDWAGIEAPYAVNNDSPQLPLEKFRMRRVRAA